MPKRFAVLGGWLVAVGLVVAAVAGMTREYEYARGKYQLECESRVSMAGMARAETATRAEYCRDPSSYMPWWYLLVAWPEGVTVWALLATLAAIVYQGYQTRRAADAAAESSDAAFRQIQMMKDKERARIEVKATGLEVQHEAGDSWNLKAGIEIRNVGGGRAYVRRGAADLVIQGGDNLAQVGKPCDWVPLDLVGNFVDPDGHPLAEAFYFFQGPGLSLAEYSRVISSGQLPVRIIGFIDYETVGTRFRLDFSFVWIGYDNPGNVGAMLTFSEELKPKNDRERISFGFWRRELTEGVDEREIDPRDAQGPK